MRFTINLATRIFLDHRLINRLAYGTIALLFAVAVWNVTRVSSNMGALSQLSSEVTAIQRRLGAKPSGISESDFSRQKARVRFYNDVIERKGINWLNVLDIFENVTPDGISLASLTTDKKLEGWKLEGRARSFKVVRNYVERLEASKNFSNVLLLSHQYLDTGENIQAVQFTISCKVVN